MIFPLYPTGTKLLTTTMMVKIMKLYMYIIKTIWKLMDGNLFLFKIYEIERKSIWIEFGKWFIKGIRKERKRDDDKKSILHKLNMSLYCLFEPLLGLCSPGLLFQLVLLLLQLLFGLGLWSVLIFLLSNLLVMTCVVFSTHFLYEMYVIDIKKTKLVIEYSLLLYFFRGIE